MLKHKKVNSEFIIADCKACNQLYHEVDIMGSPNSIHGILELHHRELARIQIKKERREYHV